MENPCDDKQDDLEITSIGVLYRGHWDKKYWSCSRGKDRYPYPVGYHAIRTHAGNTCRMEIREGLKGPLFVVTSTDGDSCTGQTPDIAWENFQKKSCPRVKNWHGKRFSSKIDGVELFGFRNPFVQRLLRELVANVSGVAERNLVSPSFCNRVTKFGHEIKIQASHAYPDLLPYLEKQQSTGKRSMQNRSSTKNLKEARVKRTRCEGLLNDTEGSTSKQAGGLSSFAKDNGTVHFQEERMSSLKDGAAFQVPSYHLRNLSGGSVATVNNEAPDPECQNDGKSIGCATSMRNCHGNEDPSSSLQVKASTVVEENCHSFLAVDEILMESKCSDCFVEKHIISNEQNDLIGHENSMLTYVDKIPLEKSLDAREQRDSFIASKHSDGEFVDLARYSDVCVPDTCDIAKDNIVGSPSVSHKGSLCNTKNELVVARPMLIASASCASGVPSRSVSEELTNKSEHVIPKSMHSLPKEVLYYVTCAPADSLSKGLIKDSLPEVGSSSGSSNPSSENIDLDLAGQELARSMMTFLLPRAVPLLTKTYVKRRSRHRSRENKNDTCSTASGPNSAEHIHSDHLTDIMCRGKNVAKIPVQPEEYSQEKMNVPQSLLGADSLCQVTRVEPPVTGCMTIEPITGSGSSKDVKSVIPDSFEDGQCVYDVAIKSRSPPGFDEADIAPSDETKGSFNSSMLPGNNAEGGKKFSSCLSGNDGCNGEVLLPHGRVKADNLLSDSLLAYVESDKCIPLKEEFADECTYEIENISRREPNYLVSKCTGVMPSLDSPHVKHNGSQLFNAECIYNAEEEILSHKYVPGHGPSRSDNAEHFEQDPPCPNINILADDEVPKTNMIQSNMFCFTDKIQSHSSNEQVNDVHAASSSRDATVRNQVRTTHISQLVLDENAEATVKGESSLFCMPNEVISTGGLPLGSHKVGRIPHSPHSSRKYNVPLSEIIICRIHKDSNAPEMHFPRKISDTDEKDQARPISSDADIRISVTNEVKADEQSHHLNTVENFPTSEHALFIAALDASQNQDVAKNVTDDMKPHNSIDPSVSVFKKDCMDAVRELCASGESCIQFQEQTKDLSDRNENHVLLGALPCSDMDPLMKSTINHDCKNLSHTQIYQKIHLDGSSSKTENSSKDMVGSMELVGCYLHPNPILSILLTSKEDGLQICVLCGLLEGDIRNLFIYVVPVQEHRGNCPSFLGYTSLVSPLLKGPCNGNMPFERFGLQFTPDGQSLVFLDSIRAPHCKEQNIDCSCTNCKSDCCEENTVEIVHVKFGYVSSVAKLTTIERISCILVCEPNYLIAAEQSGNLHVWIMNFKWSANSEEFMLPNFDCISPMILELKRIPNCNSLIIGHNGLGGFGLWDISERVLLARFSSPGSTTFQILPVGLFNWQREDSLATGLGMDEHIKETTPMADNWCLKAGEDPLLLSSGEDIVVWLLVSAALGSEAQHQVKEPNTSLAGWWRLALLVKNVVVMGSILDSRASAVCASADHGIYGTCDGFLYKWELSTGKKLANLHPFKCGGVSSVAVDAKSGALAVADDGHQLLIYAQARM